MFYRIILQGHVAQGANLADVKHQFTRVTGLPPSVTDQMFRSAPNVIKRQVAQADAERIAATLRAIGASVTLEPDYQSAAPGPLDHVTLPAIPNFGPLHPPVEPAPAQAPTARSRALRSVRKWAIPGAIAAVLVAGAAWFTPEFEQFVRKWRRPAAPATEPARKPAAEPAATPAAAAFSAALLHGPWRCTNQRDGSSTYWNYQPDGALAYLGDDLKHGDQPIVRPDLPSQWRLEGRRLRFLVDGGAERVATVDRLTLTQLEYSEGKDDATRCSRP